MAWSDEAMMKRRVYSVGTGRPKRKEISKKKNSGKQKIDQGNAEAEGDFGFGRG